LVLFFKKEHFFLTSKAAVPLARLGGMTFGITSFGAYIPRRRLSRKAIAAAHAWAMPGLAAQGKGTRAFASWDEDAITMAVEAARDCLRDAPANPAALVLASTTLPYVDRANAVVVAGALAMPGTTFCQDQTGSLRAGLGALAAACRAQSPDATMIIASELRRAKAGSAQEMAFGAGAAAITVGATGVIADYIGGASISVDLVDHYRTDAHGFDYSGEERWVREEGYGKLVPAAVASLVASTGVDLQQVKFLAPPSSNASIGALIASSLKIAPDRVVDGLAATVGDVGTAHPLLTLARALERAAPGDLILAIAFGQGCDALLFRATDAIAQPATRAGVEGAVRDARPDDSYQRYASFSHLLDYDWGPRAEADAKTPLTEQYRSDHQITPFVGGCCPECGQVQFPQFPLCVKCEAKVEFKPVRLADEPAKVATYTADWLQYSPSPPFYFGLVQFDNGARVLMEFVDVDGRTLDVGVPVRMTFRIKERDTMRDFARYFWKAVPIDSREPA
jgi:3-hydroxy-3-methylglutaryl CoA synthase